MPRVSPKYNSIAHDQVKKKSIIIFNDGADMYILAFLII